MLLFGRWWVKRTTMLAVAAWLVFIGYVFLAIFGMSSYAVSGRILLGLIPLTPVAVFTATGVAFGWRAPPELREAIRAARRN